MTPERIKELRSLCLESLSGSSVPGAYRNPITLSPTELLGLLETAVITEESCP